MQLVRQTAKALVPPRHRFAVRSAALRLVHNGGHRFCRCCRSCVRYFRSFGHRKPRPDAQCPVCGSLERDRVVTRYLDRQPILLTGVRRVLHVAPERAIAHRLRRWEKRSHVSIDIQPGAAECIMDLTDLDFADNSFDAVYCSNVLEHIERDRQAMREIRRVLTPSGWAMILVPRLDRERTQEDFSVTDPMERTRLYGQPDHVRAYGHDIVDRLEASEFSVEVEQPARGLHGEELVREGLDPEERIFLCRKAVA